MELVVRNTLSASIETIERLFSDISAPRPYLGGDACRCRGHLLGSLLGQGPFFSGWFALPARWPGMAFGRSSGVVYAVVVALTWWLACRGFQATLPSTLSRGAHTNI